MRALLRDGDDIDRRAARARLTDTTLAARARLTDTTLAGLARRRQPRQASREQALRQSEIRQLILALREAGRALKANRAELHAIVNDMAPGLTDRPGIGPVSAAQAIVSFSHTGRCRNDAAFATLAATSPIEASSGQTTRHRLNRGADRALNKAIHVIASTRIRTDPATQAYVARRTAAGTSSREIRHCIKRYVARQLYRALTAALTPTSRPAHEPAPQRARRISLHLCPAPGSVPRPRPLPGPALPALALQPHLPPTVEPARPTSPIL